MLDKPIVKNFILIGVPTIISCLSIIMALDILEKYKNVIIFIVCLLLLGFIILLMYYSKQEKSLQDKNTELVRKISNMSRVLRVTSNNLSDITLLLDTWNGDLTRIVHDMTVNNSISKKDWNYEKICDSICINCRDTILSFLRCNNSTDVSVSVIRHYQKDDKSYIKMVAHTNPRTTKPDVFNKELSLSDCSYLFAKLIKDEIKDIFVLEDQNKVKQTFYKPKAETDLSKYSQYIAIPIICHNNRILGVMQVIIKYNHVLANNRQGLIKFGETHLTPFVDFLVLAEKIEKILVRC